MEIPSLPSLRPRRFSCYKADQIVCRDGFDRLDLAMCWFIRRIQPLQHRAKYMHEHTGDRRDSLRISVDNFSSGSVKLRLKYIVKVKDKKRGSPLPTTCS